MQRAARLLVISLMVGTAIFAFAQKRSITEKDIFQFNWIGDPQISPDGARVVFVKVSVNDKKDGYDTSLWAVATRGDEAPRRMTDGKHDSSPRFSPDGKWLAFVRAPETPASAGNGLASRKDGPQLYLLPLGGGESWKLTDVPRGAGNPVWSQDSKWIAFTSDANPEDLARQKKAKPSAEKPDETKDSNSKDSRPEAGPAKTEAAKTETADSDHESDVRVITRSVYRLNGAGYLDPKHPQHIWVLAAPQSSEDIVPPKQLTSGKFQEEVAFWAKDSSKVYFTTAKVDDPSYELPREEIYSVAVARRRATESRHHPHGAALAVTQSGWQARCLLRVCE